MGEERSKISYQQWAMWAVMGLLALLTIGANSVSGRVDGLEDEKLDKEQYYREYDGMAEDVAEIRRLLEDHVQLFPHK